jgi:hypothetical protein
MIKTPFSASFDGEIGVGSPEDTRIARLNALGENLAKKRSNAIAFRQQSGIETQWIEDEEFYAGVDDANRDEYRGAWRTKPPGQYQVQAAGATRSTVFPNVTRPYVDAAAARIADMLLPTDDRSWSIRPTPIPDLVDIAKGKLPDDIKREISAGVTPEQAQKAEAALIEQAKIETEEARVKAEKAEKRIEDWNVEGQWHAEIRQVIEDSARCGTGVLKGPFPVKRKMVALTDVAEGEQSTLRRLVDGIKKKLGFDTQGVQKALVIKEEIKPTSKRIDYWDFYPGKGCGDNLHNGQDCWERGRLNARQLSELKGQPGYIDSQIDECLREGPHQAVAEDKDSPNQYLSPSDDGRFEIWYMHGFIDREDMLAAGCECDPDSHPQIPAMIAMVNNRVVKAALNPLDNGDFPYDIMPWQRKDGLPWGDGVARQGRTAQKIVTAATRHMMDNGGLSAGVQIVMKQGSIVPADGQMTLTGRKIWYWGEDADTDDIRKVMQFFEIPSRQRELQEIIMFGMKLMEDSTGLPMLLQGQQGKAPDTVGGMTLLNNNATAVLRRLARTFDDKITEPHIRRYYTWLLQYGEDDEKGDFMIDARGSSALVERDMQSQQMPQILQASGNVTFGIDPKKAMQELLKSWHLDPKRFEFTDEKWQKIVENLSQKPADPRLEVEQLRLQDKERQREFEATESAKDRQMNMAIEMIDEELTTAELSSVERQVLEKIKAELSQTAMELATQRELSAASTEADIQSSMPKPPTEPAGRANVGMAYTQ